MRAERIIVVMRKDLTEILRQRGLVLTMLIVSIYLGAVVPAVVVISASMGEGVVPISLPIPIELPGSSGDNSRAALHFAVNFIMPLIFLIIPLMISTILAADSFAGERERGTLEILLSAPMSEMEFFLSKVLASFIPGIIGSILAFILIVVSVNISSLLFLGEVWFVPGTEWFLVALVISPLYSYLAISLTVLASLRFSTAREAHQVAGILIIPLVVGIVSQVYAGILLSFDLLVYAAGSLLVLDAFATLVVPDIFMERIRYLRSG